VRRSAPRPLGSALAAVTTGARPQTLLARVQACWAEVAGPAIEAEASPVTERAGTVAVECSSAAWAQELQLLEPDLRDHLNRLLGGSPGGHVEALRFSVRRVRHNP
jgi:predicted nucleic acid-binding Zn ribbon protein